MKICLDNGVHFIYNIMEGKNAIKWTRLSCSDFRPNEVRLQLFVLAYNLANFVRCLALPRAIKDWSLTNLQEKMVKIGAKIVFHARFFTFQMTEVTVLGELLEEFSKIFINSNRFQYDDLIGNTEKRLTQDR